jgi:RNA polymerase sigma-70 factor (ECF subfamily)
MGNENKYEGLDAYAVRLIKHKARQLVGRAGFVEADRHDLEQDLVIDVLRRLPRFDPAIAKRETFIARIVEHHVATIVESQKAGIRDYRQRAGSLDERREEDDGSSADGPPVLDEKEYVRETLTSAQRDEDLHALRLDLEKVLSELPGDGSVDLRALCVRLQTSTVSDVSRETGVPRGTVYEAIGKLRTRFERAGLSVYLEGSDRKRTPPVGNR